MDQLELSHHSSSLSHKPDSTRVPNKWDSHYETF
jgi:hypothetical protein